MQGLSVTSIVSGSHHEPILMVHGYRPPPPGSEMGFMKFGCVFTDTSLKISSCNEASKQPTFRLRLLCFAADWPGKGNRIVLLSQST